MSQQRADGAFSHISDAGEAVPDVVATTFALEALRRSALAPAICHVRERGERYLQVAQSVIGQWVGEWLGHTTCGTGRAAVLARRVYDVVEG